MGNKTLVATCDCEDFLYRSGKPWTARGISVRWQDAMQLLVVQAAPGDIVGWRYLVKSPGLGKDVHIVEVSSGNGDRIDWPCKHVLRVIAEEMRRLHGLSIVHCTLPGGQSLHGGEMVEVSNGLVAVVEKIQG